VALPVVTTLHCQFTGSISDRMNWKTHPKYHPNALGFYKIYICSRILHTEKPLHP
jgi:hypothetical protein